MATTEPKAKQLPLFEGARYPGVTIAMSGGIEGDAEFLLPEVTHLKVGSIFHVVVHGTVVAKKHALKYDKDGEEQRTMTVTLKVDSIDPQITATVL